MQYDSYRDSGEQWLGQIPNHWEMVAIRYILQPQHKVVGKQANEYALLSLTLNGVIKRDMDNPTGKFPTTFDTYQEVNPDDFIFCMFDNEETPRAVGLSRYRGMITGAYDVMQNINALVNNRFLEYYFLDIDNFKKLKPLYKGLRKTVPLDSFKAMKIAIPPLPEQERMVAYLDRETAAIDAAIAQQQRMIDLLNERQQIIIQQAVTKGLDPNAKMKDSGIDWIGQIPEGWEVMRTFFAFSNIGSGTTPKSGNVEYYAESGHYFLQTGDLNDGIIEDTSKKITDSALKDTNLKFYNSGALVIAMYGATIGKLGILRIKTTVNQACCVLTPKNNIDVWFALYFFMVAKQDLILQSKGGTQPNISQDTIKSEPFLTPPIEEQQKIVQYIQQVCKPLDSAITKANEMISLLRERKQIIINEVVTGKIKV